MGVFFFVRKQDNELSPDEIGSSVLVCGQKVSEYLQALFTIVLNMLLIFHPTVTYECLLIFIRIMVRGGVFQRTQ